MSENMDFGREGVDLYNSLIADIEAVIENLNFLVGDRQRYFTVYGQMKSLLVRLEDENYYQRILKADNQTFLWERERAMPYKKDIERLIGYIDDFDRESKKMIGKIAEKGNIESEEFSLLYRYFYNLAEDDRAHDRISLKMIEFFGESTCEKCKNLSGPEYAIFAYLLIKIKSKTKLYFAYPSIADDLVALCDRLTYLPPDGRYNFLTEAGDYYAAACRREHARTCYEKASRVAKEKGDLENSAYAMQKFYRLNQTFPPSMQVEVDNDKISEEFGDYAKIVLQGVGSFMKVDPVEFTSEFAEAFQVVMWKLVAALAKRGNLHNVHQRWMLMREFFAEMNISWRSPAEMNPRVMFD